VGSFVYRSRLPHSREDVFAWHERPGALERLAPPWIPTRVVERTGGIRSGDRVVLEVGRRPLRTRWVAQHLEYEPPVRFVDAQVSGPFASWVHTHRFEAEAADASTLEDSIEYRLPGGALARVADGVVQRTLSRMFRFRHARTRDDLERHARVGGPGLRIAVTGANGLIGAQLCAFLGGGGHRVDPLVRREPKPHTTEIHWDPASGAIDAAALEGVDAVVHLAGVGIADGRWSAEQKRRILESREQGTRLLAKTLAGLERPPEVLISASAIGFYGDRGDSALDESAEAGEGFLADVCRAWEAAADPARQAGIRVVHPRIGPVMTPAGGMLEQLLLPFRLALGGPVGSGRQVVSWIDLDDVVGALHHSVFSSELSGPVNLTAPGAVTSKELARTLGRVLHRPARLPLPGAALSLALGEMARELMLAGAHVVPRALQASGFEFLHPDLESSLRASLGR
jgi:uncharacterized protein (TIGR01777 family)